MKRSTERILTTHCGSLARPPALLQLLQAQRDGEAYDPEQLDAELTKAVQNVVYKQVQAGIDVVTDGEQSKTGFAAYVRDRLDGFEPVPDGQGTNLVGSYSEERAAFPEYYEQYFGSGNMRGIAPQTQLRCVAPVKYKGKALLQTDIANLKTALGPFKAEEAFMPASAPRGVGRNEYYKSDEEYLYAVAEAMREEYTAIVNAGLVLQIDDPALTGFYGRSSALPVDQRKKQAEMYIDALNHALRGIPREQVRFHTCYGINEGPRIYDTPLADILGLLLKVNAGALSFEAANPRHEHEYHVFEDVKLPEGTVLIPGVVTHASNIVEHPEWIAERLTRYANIVGRENVIAGADCGFSSQATFNPEVHPTVVWAKFQAMAEGARLASEQLWA
ncbi:MAG: cobalamin-independent methionine synthase II family protein [Chloroflexi bacterium]|nr:cobalamin-independent methionine synthase II family protein [Chloroflexota bacterium]